MILQLVAPHPHAVLVFPLLMPFCLIGCAARCLFPGSWETKCRRSAPVSLVEVGTILSSCGRYFLALSVSL